MRSMSVAKGTFPSRSFRLFQSVLRVHNWQAKLARVLTLILGSMQWSTLRLRQMHSLVRCMPIPRAWKAPFEKEAAQASRCRLGVYRTRWGEPEGLSRDAQKLGEGPSGPRDALLRARPFLLGNRDTFRPAYSQHEGWSRFPSSIEQEAADVQLDVDVPGGQQQQRTRRLRSRHLVS
jgi:hypothetical protein